MALSHIDCPKKLFLEVTLLLQVRSARELLVYIAYTKLVSMNIRYRAHCSIGPAVIEQMSDDQESKELVDPRISLCSRRYVLQ